MRYDPLPLVMWCLGQGYYMRAFDAKPWGAVARHVLVTAGVGVPLYLAVVWLVNHVRFA